MTAHPDDDHALPADPAFDAAWRAASSEAPPPALDAAILAAARRAVDAGPQRTRDALRPGRWWWPLAAAATIGVLAIGILQLAPPDQLGAPGAASEVVSDMPALKPAPAPVPASAPSPERAAESASAAQTPAARFAAPPASLSAQQGDGAVAQDRTEAPAGAARQQAPLAPEAKKESAGAAAANRAAARTDAGGAGLARPASAIEAQRGAPRAKAFPAEERANAKPSATGGSGPVPAAPPAMAKSIAAEPAPAVGAPAPMAQPFPAGDGRRRELRDERLPATATGSVAAPTEADALRHAPLPAAEWIVLIRKLRAEGRSDDAARELAAFRRAYPDDLRLLPKDLRDWRPVPPK